MECLRKVGEKTLDFYQLTGHFSIFFLRTIFGWPKFKMGTQLWIAQLYSVGCLSLIIIVVSSLFIGMVLGLQGYTILRKFGADQALGQLIALSVVRELGPVVCALLFAGRAGTAITAEIGLMKATDQLSSMEMLGVNPIRRIVAPRFWAGQVSMPILSLIFAVVAIYGGYLVGVKWLGVDSGAFWANMQHSVDFSQDVMNGLIKSIVFGTVITSIAVYQGYECIPTAEGIGRATTRTVVYSSLAILCLDFFLTAIMFGDLK
jgi:phospholipid/cholesterol/gamma-HCH transport system permease protein